MAADAPLRVVIVGAGLMGAWHAYYVKRLGASIVGIVDKDPLKGPALARGQKSTFFSDLEPCLDRCSPHVVHICTPSPSHVALAKLALEAGAHVLIEKPLAPTLESTVSLLELAHQRQKMLTPVHQFPFQEGFRRLVANAPALGDPVRVTYEAFTAGGNGLCPDERRRLLLEILPHPFSLAMRLFGPTLLNSIETVGPQTSDDLELSAGKSSVRFHVTLSHRGRPTRNKLSYIGTAGTAHVDLFHGFAVFESGSQTSRRKKMLQPLDLGSRLVARSAANLFTRLRRSTWAYPGLPELTRAFYDAVRNGGVSPIDEAESIEIARTVDRLRVI
jgi:predicted dehydrogenase